MNEFEKKLTAARSLPILNSTLSAEGVEEFSIMVMLMEKETDEFGTPLHELIKKLDDVAKNPDAITSIPNSLLPCFAALMSENFRSSGR